MLAKRMALIFACGLLVGAGGRAALIIDQLRIQDSAEQEDFTLKFVRSATDFGFLMEDLRALSGCADPAHCRWTGRAISWWTYDNSAPTLDTTNVLAPGSATRIARDMSSPLRLSKY